MSYFVRPIRRKPRIPAYMRGPLFNCKRELPLDILFAEPTMPDCDFLKLIHKVQNEIYNCPQMFDGLHLEDDPGLHFEHRAYEYCRHRQFVFEILTNNEGFTLEFFHKEVPGKIVTFMGAFNAQGIDLQFVRIFAEKIFNFKKIIDLRRTEKR